jgi:Amt family ammonium transporter
VHRYRADDDELARKRGDLRRTGHILTAIRENRMELHYQPIVRIGDSLPAGRFGELLLRLRGEDGGLIPPDAFLPIAERYGLMSTIDRSVVAAAFSALADRYRAGRVPVGDLYSINLSSVSLGDETFLEFVRSALAEHRIPPAVICFEVTETAAITNIATTVRLMTELRLLGCRFALDDFGSGFSSFGYLKSLPVDYLKVDGHFVRGIPHDSADRAMVEAVNHIGREMGLRTIAEYVEDEAILTCLRSIGVDYAQGFGTGRPVPFAAHLATLAPHASARTAPLSATR